MKLTHPKHFPAKHLFLTLFFALASFLRIYPQSGAEAVLQKAELANEWFMQQWPDPAKDTFVRNKVRPSSLWTRAVYYEGLMALHAVAPQQRYLDYTLAWCRHHKWTPRNGVQTHDADDYCCSQTYIDMYRLEVDGATLEYVRQNLDLIIARGEGSDADWWWIDAIQMGMPVFQKLARTTGERKYAEKAWTMYEYTRNQQDGGLRNPKDGLWWRDRDFNPPYQTPAGKDCYWSRGDGWVVAALVRVLDEMKTTDAHYGDYLRDLTTMLRSLVPLQRADGFWNCSLADPDDFGGPEVTGTSLFLYGMAWCVRHGYLPQAEFAPVMERAWLAMAASIHPDGLLGWQQGTGKQPSDSQPVAFDRLPDFDDYGVGCFLLGATEYYRFLCSQNGESGNWVEGNWVNNVSYDNFTPQNINNPITQLPSTPNIPAKTLKSKTPLPSWPAPMPEAKPGVRWWWLGSAVNEEGLRYNLREMASHGIGSVEITPIYGVKGNEENNLPFLSDEWMRMLRVTQAEARKLGMQVEMNCGTGWPFGGPGVPVEEAACRLIVVDSLLSASEASRFADFPSKLHPSPASLRTLALPKKQADAQVVAQRLFRQKDKRVRVITLYQAPTGQKVKRAAPGGEGLVIDHFSAEAVRHYLDRFDRAFASTGTPFPSTFFNDSYEVYGADWTPSLPEEFRARRGYDLLDKLDRFVDGDAQVVSDYRETLSDLLLQNFTRQWADWAHGHGVQVRNQAHGSPANLIDVYSSVDVPEIEGFGLTDFNLSGLRRDPGFTKKNDSDLSMLKYAPSAAHVTGKPLASSETFTWLTEHFRTSLSQMKPDLDLMFVAGVNHVFFHGACYTPQGEPWPGWRFYASVDMSPTNSIWRDAGELTRYIERCQSWLQLGRPDNDFLVLLPVREMWQQNTSNRLMMFDIHSMQQKAPEFISQILRIDSLGYDCDYISEQLLLQTRFVDGALQTAAGTRYRGLVIPCAERSLAKATQKHVAALRRKGAHIIYKVEAEALAKAARPEEMKTRFGLKMIRRLTPDLAGETTGRIHHYFIANLTPHDIEADVTLAVDATKGNWFNPMNDEILPALFNRDGQLHLALRSGESRILCVSAENAVGRQQSAALSGQTRGEATSSPSIHPASRLLDSAFRTLHPDFDEWTLHFVESQPVVTDTFHLASLQTWETLPNDSVRELMGTGVYETTFTIRPDEIRTDRPGEPYYRLDLGDVRESARVYLNGKYLGTAWAVPMALDFRGTLREGTNTLRIEVTNLPANRIAAYDRRGVEWRRFEEINVVDLNYKNTRYDKWEPVPSGLNPGIKFMKRIIQP